MDLLYYTFRGLDSILHNSVFYIILFTSQTDDYNNKLIFFPLMYFTDILLVVDCVQFDVSFCEAKNIKHWWIFFASRLCFM